MELLDYAILCAESYGSSGLVVVEDIAFLLTKEEDRHIFTFRGSHNFMNWFRDFEAIPKRTKSGLLAHHGFVDSAEKVWTAVEALLPKDRPFEFSGHSLGGAIASIFAEHYRVPCTTFGCPRPWWKLEDVPYFPHRRVVCDDDPVPLVPHLLFKTEESAIELVLNDRDGELVNPEDHFITHYVSRLRAIGKG